MVYNFSKKDTLLLIDCSIGFLWKKKTIRRRRFSVKILIFKKMDKKSSILLKQPKTVLNDNFGVSLSAKDFT